MWGPKFNCFNVNLNPAFVLLSENMKVQIV